MAKLITGSGLTEQSGTELTHSGGVKVSTTSEALTIPTLTTAERDAIASPAAGMLIYNTTLKRYDLYSGSAWTGQSSSYIYADWVVGSSAQVAAGLASHTSISSAISDASSDDKILILEGTYTEAVTVNKRLMIEGVGNGSFIDGTLTFTSAADRSLVSRVRVGGNVTFNSGADGIFMRECWLVSFTTTANTTASSTFVYGVTSSRYTDLSVGTTVSGSGITAGTTVASKINYYTFTLPASASFTAGQTYLNNGSTFTVLTTGSGTTLRATSNGGAPTTPLTTTANTISGSALLYNIPSGAYTNIVTGYPVGGSGLASVATVSAKINYYTFTLPVASTFSVGQTFTNNGSTFTVLAPGTSATTLRASSNGGAPTTPLSTTGNITTSNTFVYGIPSGDYTTITVGQAIGGAGVTAGTTVSSKITYYTFTLAAATTFTAGQTYTNNGNTFTVLLPGTSTTTLRASSSGGAPTTMPTAVTLTVSTTSAYAFVYATPTSTGNFSSVVVGMVVSGTGITTGTLVTQKTSYYVFTLAAASTFSAGWTFTNNGRTFTVLLPGTSTTTLRASSSGGAPTTIPTPVTTTGNINTASNYGSPVISFIYGVSSLSYTDIQVGMVVSGTGIATGTLVTQKINYYTITIPALAAGGSNQIEPGTTYSSNGSVFTILTRAIAGTTTLFASSNGGAPSGTLTKISGTTGQTPITVSSSQLNTDGLVVSPGVTATAAGVSLTFQGATLTKGTGPTADLGFTAWSSDTGLTLSANTTATGSSSLTFQGATLTKGTGPAADVGFTAWSSGDGLVLSSNATATTTPATLLVNGLLTGVSGATTTTFSSSTYDSGVTMSSNATATASSVAIAFNGSLSGGTGTPTTFSSSTLDSGLTLSGNATATATGASLTFESTLTNSGTGNSILLIKEE